MTELRDARLRHALEQAPDAHLQPPARVRAAIHAAAHGAVQPAWRRWWPRAGSPSPSWMAALAGVLVATLVVVIWQGQEVPGVRDEAPLADRPAPAPVVEAPAAAPAPAVQARSPATPAPAPAPRAAVRREQPKPEVAARQETAKAAPPPPPPPVAPAPPPPPVAPAPAPAMAPPALPAAAPAPAGAPALTARFAAPPTAAWTQVRIVSGERSVLLARSQAESLPALVNQVLLAPREPAPLALPLATLRLELGAQGVLEWSEDGWRLLPQGDPQRSQLVKANEATAAALRAEAERLLDR